MKGIIALAAFTIIGIFIVRHELWRVKRKAELKQIYQDSLKGNDRAAALTAGRNYYASIRNGGRLTIYDEQAITNDLSTMKD